MPAQPLCFILMPFGKKKDPSRPRKPEIDFDAIYELGIAPGISDADMKPIRADKEETLGIIHKAMFERLLLCDFAVADLTLQNANVFYELGVRHASRYTRTLPVFADHVKLPFDVALLRALPYKIGKDNSFGEKEAAALRKAVGESLKTLRELARKADATDSPVFQLLAGSQQSNLPADERLRRVKTADSALYELLNRYTGHEKTDIFRDAVEYSTARKKELAEARARPTAEARAELNRIRGELPLDAAESGVIVDLYLSFRAVGAWDEMIALYHDMPEILKRSVLVREQLAFALNRRAPRDPKRPQYRGEALELLKEVAAQIGPSSETCGLMGRVYKDLWREARDAGSAIEAQGHLERAIRSYVSGFEADCRDAYPGVNAVTLLDIEGSDGSLARKRTLIPVVRYAVDRRIAGGAPDYWDYATLVELETLAENPDAARAYLASALAAVRESWEPATTIQNLTDIADARVRRGEDAAWVREICRALKAKADSM